MWTLELELYSISALCFLKTLSSIRTKAYIDELLSTSMCVTENGCTYVCQRVCKCVSDWAEGLS